MSRYVVGLLFNLDMSLVVLIEKTRPEWQRGKLNGIGGKIDFVAVNEFGIPLHWKELVNNPQFTPISIRSESPLEAMNREWLEETGDKEPIIWNRFARQEIVNRAEIFFFYARSYHMNLDRFKKVTDEFVSVFEVSWIMNRQLPVIADLRWLIMMVLNDFYDESERHKEYEIISSR